MLAVNGLPKLYHPLFKHDPFAKATDDGFFIAEEDLKLRGFGDLIGYQQSGIKNFKFADPIKHENLFKLAEYYVKNHINEINHTKYSFLLKLFDKAEIINIKEF